MSGEPVLVVSAGAFAAGELVQAFRRRRGSALVDARAEVLFRVVLLGGILMLPLGRAVVPGAAIGGGVWRLALGAVIGWLGLLLRPAGPASFPTSGSPDAGGRYCRGHVRPR